MENSAMIHNRRSDLASLIDESSQSHSQNESTASSEDLFFENTIVEIEDLIGNEEEFRSFIDCMLKEDTPEQKSKKNIPTLDVNCNEVIPVVDICSSSENEADTEEQLEKDAHLSDTETPTTPFSKEFISPKSLCGDSETPNPVSIIKTPSALCGNSKSLDSSFEINSPGSFLCSDHNEPPKSELLSLGVKNVSASFLDYKPFEKLPTSSLSTDVFPSEISSQKSEWVSRLATGNSLEPSSKGKILDQILRAKMLELLDENSNLSDTDLLEENFPSPRTEELLLREAEDKVQDFVEATSPEVPLATVSTETCLLLKPTPSQVAENSESSCAAFEPVEENSTGIFSIPSPPPAHELLEEGEVEDYALLEKYLPPAPSGDEVDVESSLEATESSHVTSLSSEPSAPIDFKFLAVQPPALEVEKIRPLEETQDSELGVPCELYPDDTSSATAGGSKSQELPSWAVPWVSTDEAENIDNNDPEWDLMKKLETDEERYRVVREKWRQLSIPDPRVDLTRHNYRRSRSQALRVPSNEAPGTGRQSRKRARSHDASDDEHPSKRRRMFSCTQMFDNKINFIRRELDGEYQVLKSEHHKRLSKLSSIQQQQHQRLMNSRAPSYIVRHQFNDLAGKQEREVYDLNAEFDDRLHQASKSRLHTIKLLQMASQEVLTFNQFYTDLGDVDDDHCNITEDEFQQFEETEQMYELYDQIYSE